MLIHCMHTILQVTLATTLFNPNAIVIFMYLGKMALTRVLAASNKLSALHPIGPQKSLGLKGAIHKLINTITSAA